VYQNKFTWAPIQVFSPTPAPAWVADWPIQAHRLQADTPMPQQVLALLQAQGFGSVLVEGGRRGAEPVCAGWRTR
jgi:riboflavin biosynthesis pyrimidine reductase